MTLSLIFTRYAPLLCSLITITHVFAPAAIAAAIAAML